jgi:hypothetical protein
MKDRTFMKNFCYNEKIGVNVMRWFHEQRAN